MAESGLIAPIFRTAVGWLSDDRFTGIDGSFFASKNINIRDNGKWISLEKALVIDSSTTVTEKINKIFKTTTGKYVAFGASWGIYRKDTTTWAKITTDSPATEIFDAIEFNWYIYWATATYLHRLAIANLSSNITATDVINRQALVSSAYHPMLVSMWDLFIGNGSRVDKVNTSNVWEALILMETGSVVKKLNDLGGSIRVVTIPAVWNNNIYLWNGTSDMPDQTIPLFWTDIRQSYIFNGYNYLVTNKWLGILDWYKIYPIKKITQFNNNINSIAVHDEKLYIWGIGWVYIYGNNNKNYPEVLNLWLSSSNGSATDVIWAIYSDGTDLYVSWSNWAKFWIDKLSTTVYYAQWELETRGYYANSLYEIKEAIVALCGYKQPITWQKITIYAWIDGWAYTKLLEIWPTTDTKAIFTEDIFVRLGSFQYIQFKIVLDWPWTSTPEFYSLDLSFNNNLKR